MNFCPCDFTGWEHEAWSPDWHRAHRDHHLATFPDVDQGTRDNLDSFVEFAQARAEARRRLDGGL